MAGWFCCGFSFTGGKVFLLVYLLKVFIKINCDLEVKIHGIGIMQKSKLMANFNY